MSESEDSTPSSGTDARIADAFAALVEPIEPGPQAWSRIVMRIDDGAVKGDGVSRSRTLRPIVVAAAVLAVVVLSASVVLLGRRDQGTNVVTQPIAPSLRVPAIVAMTADGRIVELTADGQELRTIVALGSAAPAVDPTIRVSADGIVYFNRDVEPVAATCAEQIFGRIWMTSEIVAVPLAGGAPRVVVPVGGAFDLSPDGRLLAYAGPEGTDRCLDASQSLLSVMEVASGRRTQLADRPFSAVGPASRLRWLSGGAEITGVASSWFHDRGPSYASILRFVLHPTEPQAPAQQIMIASQDPDRQPDLGSNGDEPIAMPGPLGGTVVMANPANAGDTSDLQATQRIDGAQDLVAVERTSSHAQGASRHHGLVVVRAQPDENRRGNHVSGINLPSTKLAELPAAASGFLQETSMDVVGARVLVTTAETDDIGDAGCCTVMGRRPPAGHWTAKPTHAFVIESGRVTEIADGLVAAAWLPPGLARHGGGRDEAAAAVLPSTTGAPVAPPTVAVGTVPPLVTTNGTCRGDTERQVGATLFAEAAKGLPAPVRGFAQRVWDASSSCDPSFASGGAKVPGVQPPPYRPSIYEEVLAMLSVPPTIDAQGRYRWGGEVGPLVCPARPTLAVSADGAGWEWRLPCDAEVRRPGEDQRDRRPADAQQVALAYERVFNGDPSLLEGAVATADAQEQRAGSPIAVEVRAIRWSGEDAAEVEFILRRDGYAVSPPSTGGAIRRDGVWKVTAATMCDVLARVQIPCPTGS
jgi:hypothetical protein